MQFLKNLLHGNLVFFFFIFSYFKPPSIVFVFFFLFEIAYLLIDSKNIFQNVYEACCRYTTFAFFFSFFCFLQENLFSFIQRRGNTFRVLLVRDIQSNIASNDNTETLMLLQPFQRYL